MFKLTPRQEQANAVLASGAVHVCLFGGSRSGKTFLLMRAVVVRALKAPGSRHAVLRYRFGHIKASIVFDTFPKVMQVCFPGVAYELSKSDWYATMPNGAQIWFGGLDDKERVEKILGNEYATIYLNECSQIPWNSRNMAVTRLAQACVERVEGREDRPLPLRMYYDENPPDKGHWTYRLFVQKVDPETKKELAYPMDYAALQMNPKDNTANLPAGYMQTLEGLSARLQRRFLHGEFKDASPNALFSDEILDKWRVLDGDVPDMQRVIIAVDPSGSDDTDNADNDEIGIVVVGLGTDGNGYMIEDLTVKAGPATWGRIVSNAYDRHSADKVVAEVNFGGAMVRQVLQSARKNEGQPPMPFKAVTASRGKVVRAEPISSMVEMGRVRMVGYFRPLEEELCGFTTSGYTGESSPNRADAFVWGFAELFPALTTPDRQPTPTRHRPVTHQGWLG